MLCFRSYLMTVFPTYIFVNSVNCWWIHLFPQLSFSKCEYLSNNIVFRIVTIPNRQNTGSVGLNLSLNLLRASAVFLIFLILCVLICKKIYCAWQYLLRSATRNKRDSACRVDAWCPALGQPTMNCRDDSNHCGSLLCQLLLLHKAPWCSMVLHSVAAQQSCQKSILHPKENCQG